MRQVNKANYKVQSAGITLRDHKCNTWIRHQACVNYIIDVIKKVIHGWAGHIARFKDNKWTKRMTEWTPRVWTIRLTSPGPTYSMCAYNAL